MSSVVRPGLRRKLAFLFSGTCGFVLYWGLSLLLVRIPGVEPEVAAFVAVLLSVPPTFLLQKRFAFRYRGDTLPSFTRYCMLQGFNAVAIGILARLGRQAGLPDGVNFVASGGVVIVVSYLALSLIVFRSKERRP